MDDRSLKNRGARTGGSTCDSRRKRRRRSHSMSRSPRHARHLTRCRGNLTRCAAANLPGSHTERSELKFVFDGSIGNSSAETATCFVELHRRLALKSPASPSSPEADPEPVGSAPIPRTGPRAACRGKSSAVGEKPPAASTHAGRPAPSRCGVSHGNESDAGFRGSNVVDRSSIVWRSRCARWEPRTPIRSALRPRRRSGRVGFDVPLRQPIADPNL